MQKRFVALPAALCALAILSAPLTAGAQTAPTDQPASAAAPAVAAQTAIPKALSDLGITDATMRGGDKGRWIEGKLPDGAAFQAKLSDDGQVRMMRRADGSALPQDIVDKLVPEAVRASPTFPAVGAISMIMQGDQFVMVAGRDSSGQMVRAGFSADGTLQRFGRGDGKHDNKKGGHGWGKHGKDRGMHGQMHGKDQHKQGGDRMPMGLTDNAARGAVEGAGYTKTGAITHQGPRTMVEAVNPNGENVTVELSPRGDVIRETAR